MGSQVRSSIKLKEIGPQFAGGASQSTIRDGFEGENVRSTLGDERYTSAYQ